MITRDRAFTAVYRACLVAYPRDFRAAYGPEMVQVFRTAVRNSRAPLALLARALSDLTGSALRERMTFARWDVRYLLVWMAASLLSFAGGYLHLHGDADRMTAVLVLGGAFLCGFVYPGKAFRWGVIVGIGVPLALLMAHGSAGSHHSHDADSLSPLALLPALFGAYAGAILAALMRLPAVSRSRL